ncbi:hypothetical protein ONZ45_g18801 [Pleurotus djamor]|nr:hypothetical protein ONZ45_g18801 [Pleurotus djamor]
MDDSPKQTIITSPTSQPTRPSLTKFAKGPDRFSKFRTSAISSHRVLEMAENGTSSAGGGIYDVPGRHYTVGGRRKILNSQKRTKRWTTIATVPSSCVAGVPLVELSRWYMKIWPVQM